MVIHDDIVSIREIIAAMQLKGGDDFRKHYLYFFGISVMMGG